MRVGGQTLARVATLINSHPRLTGPLLLEIREFFKTGHPLTNIINAKFNAPMMKITEVSANLISCDICLFKLYMEGPEGGGGC